MMYNSEPVRDPAFPLATPITSTLYPQAPICSEPEGPRPELLGTIFLSCSTRHQYPSGDRVSESIKQLALVFTRKKILGLIKAIQCRIDASRIPLSVELQGMKFNDQDWSINARLTVGTTCAIPVERLEDCGHFVRNHLTVVVGAWGYRQEIHLADSVETGPCIRAPIDSPEQSRR